jgi:predicted nucleic acid-binding protein
VKVVLDLNVLLDVLLVRHDSLECAEVLSLARSGTIEAILPAHGLTTIYYVSRKVLTDNEVRRELREVLKIVRVEALDSVVLLRAIDSPIADFEDAVVAETAIEVSAEAIITRNIDDFSKSSVPAMSARDFMEKIFRDTIG